MHEDILCQVQHRRNSSDSDQSIHFSVPMLRTDLITVKSLNSQGYRIIHNADPNESGIFPVVDEKIDTSKSFAFMSEHSIFISKQKSCRSNNLARSRVMRNGTEGWAILQIKKCMIPFRMLTGKDLKNFKLSTRSTSSIQNAHPA